MAIEKRTAPASAPEPVANVGVLRARIRELGDALSGLRESGKYDMAREVEAEQHRLRLQLADLGGAPELTVDDCVDLLAAVAEALASRDRASLPDRVEWIHATLHSFLTGRQDVWFATSFLRAQTRRLTTGGDTR